MNIQNRSVKFNFGRTVFNLGFADLNADWLSLERDWWGLDFDGWQAIFDRLCDNIFQKMVGLPSLRRVTVKLNFWWKFQSFSSLNKKIFKVYKPLVFINNAKCLKCLNRFIKMHVIIYQHVKARPNPQN